MMGTDGATVDSITAAQMENVPIGCFIDWEMLSECGYFIGDLTRAFFRVPLLLHMSRRRQVPPTISIRAHDWQGN
jgi:hypothetical protein